MAVMGKWGWEKTRRPQETPEQLRRENAQEEAFSSPPIHSTHQRGRETGRRGEEGNVVITPGSRSHENCYILV